MDKNANRAVPSKALLASEAAAYLRDRGFFEGTEIPHHCGEELGEELSKHGWTKVAELMAGFAGQAIEANKEMRGDSPS